MGRKMKKTFIAAAMLMSLAVDCMMMEYGIPVPSSKTSVVRKATDGYSLDAAGTLIVKRDAGLLEN
jgi:hypothetical protein